MATEGIRDLLDEEEGETTETGEIVKKIFESDDGWYVLRLEREDGSRFTATGNVVDPRIGMRIEATGEWTNHNQYGRQFDVESYEEVDPASEGGIKRYLQSYVEEIGPTLASRIVEEFGDDVIAMIDRDPSVLTSVEGIGESKIESIREDWDENKRRREILVFLRKHDVSERYAARIYELYEEKTIEVLEDNPYRLIEDMDGVGFTTADGIAMDLGVDENSRERVEAAIRHTLREKAGSEGHVYLPYEEVAGSVVDLIGSVDRSIGGLIKDMAEENEITVEKWEDDVVDVSLTRYWSAEEGVADRMSSIIRNPEPDMDGVDVDSLPIDIDYNEEQRRVLEEALGGSSVVLTGGPGTGKTTTVRGLIAGLERLERNYKLAAPTGIAAQRLSDATDRDATTVHRMLDYQPGLGFGRNEENQLEVDVVIVDEMSMCNLLVMEALVRAVPDDASLVLVGDPDQLPPVGVGLVLRDLIRFDGIETVELTELYRQAKESGIVVNARRINEGERPRNEDRFDDFFYVEVGKNDEGKDDEEQALDLVTKLTVDRLPEKYGYDPKTDVQVMAPMYDGECGVDNLNEQLQRELNPGAEQVFGNISVGDKIMQERNDYDLRIYNGETGTVRGVEDDGVLVEMARTGREVKVPEDKLDNMTLAYAATVHKVQGTEAPVIVVPVLMQHYTLLRRYLLYTAVTRAEEMAVVVGSKQALNVAVKKDDQIDRYTRLTERLEARI